MMGFWGMHSLFAALYFLVIATLLVLVVWVLILAIVFLRLRIAELKRSALPPSSRE